MHHSWNAGPSAKHPIQSHKGEVTPCRLASTQPWGFRDRPHQTTNIASCRDQQLLQHSQKSCAEAACARLAWEKGDWRPADSSCPPSGEKWTPGVLVLRGSWLVGELSRAGPEPGPEWSWWKPSSSDCPEGRGVSSMDTADSREEASEGAWLPLCILLHGMGWCGGEEAQWRMWVSDT